MKFGFNKHPSPEIVVVENTKVGPFLILKRLGNNRRQKVYHARQESQGKDVVLKFINVPSSIEWPKAIDKIQREAVELRKLRHENLVRTFGAGVHEEEKQIFFANELVEGEALSSILARRGKLTPDLVAEYGHQIAEALKYVHNRDIVHSKLMPEKILVTTDHKIKILDLRLNRAKKRRWDATRKRDLEIAAYMAPEQFNEGPSQKSDFYSLGVILFEMLTGRLPYEPDTMGRMARTKKEAEAPSISAEVMNCPIWLDKIITQMLQSDPRKRPHSARAITFAFEEIKKIDATQKSAVSQVSGNFNPLTAGADKSEARRLLGKKEAPKPENDQHFYQKTPFMLASLILIGFLISIPFWPGGESARLERVKEMVATRDPNNWRDASSQLLELRKSSDPEIKSQATQLFFDNREQMLERAALNNKKSPGYSVNVLAYVAAVQDMINGNKPRAKQRFQQLIAEVDPDGKERHVFRAATKRLQQISADLKLPEEPATLLAMVDTCRRATNRLELEQSDKTLGKIVISCAGKTGFSEVRDRAERSRAFVQKQLLRLKAGEPLLPIDTPLDESVQVVEP